MRTFPLLLATSTLLMGCAGESVTKAQTALNRNNATLAGVASRAALGSPQTGRITQRPDIFLGNETIDIGRGVALPDATGTIDFLARDPLPLSSVARALSEQAGYPVVSIIDDAPRFTGRLSGDLPGVLAALKADYGIAYEHRDGTILLIPAGVEIIPIPVVPMASLPSAGLSNSSSRARATQATQAQTQLNGRDSISSPEGLRAFLSALPGLIQNGPYAGTGTSVSVNERLSTIAIKAPPAAMGGVKALIEDRLAQILTPTQMTLRIFALDVGDSRSFSTNLDYVWASLFGGQAARIVGNSTSTLLSLPRSQPAVKLDSFDGAVQTIATRLNVLNNQRFTVRLTPGNVTPISDTRIVTYVRESTPPGQSSNSSVTQTTAQITQDEFEVGTRGTVVANPLSKTSVRVAYNFDIAQLLDLRTLTSGNVTVQQPDTAPRTFANVVDLRSGETVLADARLITTNRKSGSGAISADLPLPGSLGSENRLQLVLVLVSADLINPAAPVRDPAVDNVLKMAGGE